MHRDRENLSTALKEEAKKEGFNPVGIARVPGSQRLHLRTAALQRWLEAGHHGQMKWMEAPRRKNVETLLEGINSVLVVGLNYYTDVDAMVSNKYLIARYAWGKDYHKVIEKRLKRIGKWLKNERPSSRWKICVDSKPMLEKAWAEEAGLGWIGKNSNIINSKNGSWMVLGFLLSTEKLIADEAAIPLCGKCDKCITSCPTNAIEEPFVINANNCLAYHNIENRNKKLPNQITRSINNWIAGCDICQEVCPWNNENIPINNDPDIQPQEWIANLTKEDIFSWDDKRWSEELKESALKRIKPWMWRRNAKAIEKSHNDKRITS